jgi:hypothetical protein
MDTNAIELTDALNDSYITKDAMGRIIVYLKGEDHPDAVVNLEWIDEQDRFKLIEEALAIYNER